MRIVKLLALLSLLSSVGCSDCPYHRIGPDEMFVGMPLTGQEVTASYEGSYDLAIVWTGEDEFATADFLPDLPFYGRSTVLHIELRALNSDWVIAFEEGASTDCGEFRRGTYEQPARMRIYSDDGVIDDEVDVMVEHTDLAFDTIGRSPLWSVSDEQVLAGALAESPEPLPEQATTMRLYFAGGTNTIGAMQIGVSVYEASTERIVARRIVLNFPGTD